MHKGINPLYHTYTRVYKHVSQVFEGFFLLSLSFVIPIGPMPDNGQSSFKKLNIFCFIVYYNTFEQKSKENGQQVVIISAKYIFRDSFLVVVVIRPCSNRCCQVLLLVIHKIHTTSQQFQNDSLPHIIPQGGDDHQEVNNAKTTKIFFFHVG